MTVFEAKVIEVSVQELSRGDDSIFDYTFIAYEFPNGVVMVPGETTNDWFFEDRDSIEPNGNGVVTGVSESGRTVPFSAGELEHSIQCSISEFGEDAGTAKALAQLSQR